MVGFLLLHGDGGRGIDDTAGSDVLTLHNTKHNPMITMQVPLQYTSTT